MHDVDDRLTAAARSAAERAGLPDAPVIRDHGRRIVRRRRTARTAGAVTLAAAVVAVIGIGGGFGLGGTAAPVAPANGGTLGPKEIDTTKVEVTVPDPVVTEKPGSIELRGDTPGRKSEGWSYAIRPGDDGLCVGYDVQPLGTGAECGGTKATIAADPVEVSASCVAQPPGDVTSTVVDAQADGKDEYATMITGLVGPKVETVRVELLDGRALLVKPVPSREFGVGLVAAYLPECVTQTYSLALDAGGKVLAVTPSFQGDRGGLTDEGMSQVRKMDPQGSLEFSPKATAEKRRAVLQAIERRGAQINRTDGDRYDISIEYQGHRNSVRMQLEDAERDGDLASFTLSKGTQELGPNQP
jgi:hypothetical protein